LTKNIILLNIDGKGGNLQENRLTQIFSYDFLHWMM